MASSSSSYSHSSASSSSFSSSSSDAKSEVKVLTWNVCGVLYGGKKSKLEIIENVSQYDVMGVTETHLSGSDRSSFKKRYSEDYEVYHTTPEYVKNEFKHGVALLIRKGSVLAGGKLLEEKVWDDEGRVLVYETESFGLIVVAYLPTPNRKRFTKREEYDRNFYKFLVDSKDKLLAVMGDFNMTLTEFDQPKTFGKQYKKAAVRGNEMIRNCRLFDAFRDTFKENKVYTSYQAHFKCPPEKKVGRVDYIFLNENLKEQYSVKVLGPAFEYIERDGIDVFNGACMKSDHRPLVSSMTIETLKKEDVAASSGPVDGSNAINMAPNSIAPVRKRTITDWYGVNNDPKPRKITKMI